MNAKILLISLAGLTLMACTTSARVEQSSTDLGGTEHKWIEVSYRRARDRGDAEKVAADFCAPAPYHLVDRESHITRETTPRYSSARGDRIGGDRVGGAVVDRTYVEFECGAP
jgi:hypothetical protein